MRAIILVGGQGKRLQPYTTIFPKPLLPLGEKPILEIIIRQLKNCGFDRVTFAAGYLASLFQSFFDDGEKFGVKVDYSLETKRLGTAGPIALISDLGREENFLVMNGDILTDLDYKKLFEEHRRNDAIMTIASHQNQIQLHLGVIGTDANNYLVRYDEKPRKNYLSSMGIYIYNRRILEYIKKNEYLDFPNLVQSLLKGKEKVKSYPYGGIWIDMGQPHEYERAIKVYQKNKEKFDYV